MRNLSTCWMVCWALGALTTVTPAQTPTFSLELTQINSVPICGRGVSEMTVAPGDILTAEILLRDWSPNNERMRAFQAEVDTLSFATGESGSVKPVGYDRFTLQGLQNTKNAYIDLTDLRFAHAGEQAIAFADTDTVAPGYRWMSVLFRIGGPVNTRPQGVKDYCGTLKLMVSEDARGTFTIGFVEGAQETMLRTPEGKPIEPIETEPLTLHVTTEDRPVWITSSNPECGSVDARWLTMGNTAGVWDRISMVFSDKPVGLSAADLRVEDGTATPPRVRSVKISDRNATVVLDRPIAAGAMTIITHTPSGTGTRIGRFPGDVNNDGITNSRDLGSLIRALNGDPPLPAYCIDLDGNGVSNAPDTLTLIAWLNQG